MANDDRNEPEGLQCTSCGAPLPIASTDQTFVTCEYCGTSFSVSDLLGESDDVKKARIWADAYRDAPEADEADETASADGNAPLPPNAATKRRGRATSTKRMGGATIVKVVLLACGILTYGLFGAACLGMGVPLAGMVCLLQAALLAFAVYLVVAKKTPPAANLLCILAVVLSLLLVVPWSYVFNEGYDSGYSRNAEELSWDSMALAEQVPAVGKNMGYVYVNSSTRLHVEVEGVSQAEYSAYAAECRDAGYTIEQEMSTDSFSAFNEEGYHLELDLYSSMSEMDIVVEAPKPMTTLIWPSGTIADAVPQPDATMGYVEYASATSASIYVDDMPKDAVQAYRQTCIDAGFSNVEIMDNEYLSAIDADGRELTVRYEGNEVMSIYLYAAS